MESNKRNGLTMIDLTPEIKHLPDNTIGYFYNLTQLEAIRDKNTNYEEHFSKHSHPLACGGTIASEGHAVLTHYTHS